MRHIFSKRMIRLACNLMVSVIWASPLFAQMHGNDHHDIMMLVSPTNPVFPRTHLAARSGNWSDPQTWINSRIPDANARVHIPAGIQVNYDLVASPALRWIRIDGTLGIDSMAARTLSVDTIVVMMTGRLHIGSAYLRVSQALPFRLQFTTGEDIRQDWDPKKLSRGLLSLPGSQVSLYGESKRPYQKIAAGATAGSRQLQMLSKTESWVLGDRVLIPSHEWRGGWPHGSTNPADYRAPRHEIKSISQMSQNQILLDSPLLETREIPYDQSFQAFAANLSRAIQFGATTGSSTPIHRRPHIMLMGQNNVIDNVSIRSFGRTNKTIDIDDHGMNIDGRPGNGTNIRGRYALHFHKTGTLGNPSIVRGSVVEDSPGWGIVAHGAYVIFQENVVWDVDGAAIVSEDGNERGHIVGNFTVGGVGRNLNHDIKSLPQLLNFDLASAGHGYWLQSRNLVVDDNYAFGHSDAAFVWFHRSGPNGPRPEISYEEHLNPLIHLRERAALKPDHAAIASAKANFAAGSYLALHVIKDSRLEASQPRNKFSEWVSLYNDSGGKLEYTQAYNITKWKIYGRHANDSYKFAFEVGNAARDMVFDTLFIDGYGSGIKLNTNSDTPFVVGGISDTPGGLPLKDDTLLINIQFGSGLVPGQGFVHYNPLYHRILSLPDFNPMMPVSVAFQPSSSLQLPSTLNHLTTGSFLLRGTVQDSLGSFQIYPSMWEGYSLKAALQNEGACTRSNGTRFIPLQERIQDRRGHLSFATWNGNVEVPSSYSFYIPERTNCIPMSSQTNLGMGSNDFLRVAKDISVTDTLERLNVLDNDSSNTDGTVMPSFISISSFAPSIYVLSEGEILLPQFPPTGVYLYAYQAFDRSSGLASPPLGIQIDFERSFCGADMNADLTLDGGDIQLFFQNFLSQNSKADLNQDGVLNASDVRLFMDAMNGQLDC